MSQTIIAPTPQRIRPLRIAHVTATYPPYYGGTGAVCYHNAVGLARLGHEVTVFTAARDGETYRASTEGEIEVVRLAAPYHLGNAPFTPALFDARLRGFDLVHLHYPYYFGGEAVWRNHLRGVPYVITYHQDVKLRGARDLAVRLHHNSLGKLVLGGARLIMATSLDYAANSRLARLPRPLRERVKEMPNGVDTNRFYPQSQPAARRELGFAEHGQLILFVGGLDTAHYFKGVTVLLDAMHTLRRTAVSKQVQLVVVGDGDLRPTYEAMARGMGIDAAVRFAGRVEDRELPLYYAAADVVALPSTTAGEAFGVVLLEAMASARVVVASNLAGVRSVVSDEVDGLLARPGDASDLAAKLLALLATPQRMQAMGLAGRLKAEERYSWPQLIERLLQYYNLALGGSKWSTISA